MSADHDFTPEQTAVLDSTSRVTVVAAGPGSGKTKVFVEALRRAIQDCGSDTRVAALSFTNVAQEEIASRLVHFDRSRHFVGTLDAFFLRFVVRPFAHLYGIAGGVELLPAASQVALNPLMVQVGEAVSDRAAIGDISFVGGTVNTPKLTYRSKFGTQKVSQNRVQGILDLKWRLWQKNGRITHSDSHYLAAALLAGSHSASIIKIISRRFPIILVDEFQDTNAFHARALFRLLKHSSVKALVVGDPNQSIYEFGGASPEVFDAVAKLEGAEKFHLTETHRCRKRIAHTLSAFLNSGKEIKSSQPESGRCVMLVHNITTTKPDSSLIENITRLTKELAKSAVLARKDSTLAKLLGQGGDEKVTGSRVAAAIHQAAARLAVGDARTGAEIVAQELSNLVLNGKRPTKQRLLDAGISIKAWRLALYNVLRAGLGKDGQTWEAWIVEVRKTIESEVFALVGKKEKLGQKIKAPTNKGMRFLTKHKHRGEWPENLTFSNVHQVKGAEFDGVVFYIPKPSSNQPCPSHEWWSESEERRVTFVAMSRPKHLLCLCVHQTTYRNLMESRPRFVETFEVMFLGEAKK